MSLVSQRPGPLPRRAFRFPSISRRTAGGSQVVAADLPGRMTATAVLLFDAGSLREPPGREGVASVAARLIREGTAELDPQDYARQVERLGARVHADADWDRLRVEVSAPVDRLAAAVALAGQAVREPRWAEARRVRDERVDSLRTSWARPGVAAMVEHRRAMYGRESRYGAPGGGSPDSIAAISPDDVVDFHRRWLAAPSAVLVSGDLDRLDLDELAGAAGAGGVGGTAAAASSARPTPPPAPTGRRLVLVDRPGAVQSALYLGHVAPPRGTPEYPQLTTMVTVLGGLFHSRLNLRLREVKGYAYGVGAFLDLLRDSGRLVIRTSVETSVTADALDDTVAEVTRLQEEGVEPQELTAARTYLAGNLVAEMETPDDVADALDDLVTYGLPDDYFPRLRAELTEVSQQAVDEAAARWLRSNDLIMVVEGDAATCRKPLEETGLAPLEVVG